MRRLRADDPQVRAAGSLYRQGDSLSEVAAKLGVHGTTAHKYVKLAGVEPRPLGAAISAARQAKYAPLHERRRSALGARQMRPEGLLTFPEAEDRYSIPQWCLRNWVKEGRLAIAPDVQGEDIRRLRATGLSMQVIADQLGVQKRVVQLRLEGKRRRGRLLRATDVEKLIAEPYVCQGCGQPVEPGRDWHPSCARNRDPERRAAAVGAAATARLQRLHARNVEMLKSEGLAPMAQAAELIGCSVPSVHRKVVVERRRGNLMVRLGVNARDVLPIAKDPNARGKLAKALAALNGTAAVGRPRAELSDHELQLATTLRAQGRGWRRVADAVNGERAAVDALSHETVRQAFERQRSAAP